MNNPDQIALEIAQLEAAIAVQKAAVQSAFQRGDFEAMPTIQHELKRLKIEANRARARLQAARERS